MSVASVAHKGKTILVTGITGFAGSHVALSALRAGYTVRGTVRSLEKADKWKLKNSGWEDRLSFIQVSDFTIPGAFDTAIQGVDYVLHVASPLRAPDASDNEGLVLKPAINGTLEVLRAATKEPRVSRVVVTSSVITAVGDLNPADRAGKLYTEADWFPVTYQDGVDSKVPYFVYTVSKTLAEKAAWDFMKENRPAFTLTTLLPSIILGEPAHPLEPGESVTGNRAIAVALDPAQDVTKIPAPHSYVDVRDLGDAHVIAAEHPAAANERFLIATPYTHIEWVKTLGALFPSKSVAQIPEGYVPAGHHQFDLSKAPRMLGLKYRTPEQSFGEAARWILRSRGEMLD